MASIVSVQPTKKKPKKQKKKKQKKGTSLQDNVYKVDKRPVLKQYDWYAEFVDSLKKGVEKDRKKSPSPVEFGIYHENWRSDETKETLKNKRNQDHKEKDRSCYGHSSRSSRSPHFNTSYSLHSSYGRTSPTSSTSSASRSPSPYNRQKRSRSPHDTRSPQDARTYPHKSREKENHCKAV